MSSEYTGCAKWLYDWQTLIAGVLALVAAIVGGFLAYRAGTIQAKQTRESAELQLDADRRQSRFRGGVIAVGIYPELLFLKENFDYAKDLQTKIVSHKGAHPSYGKIDAVRSLQLKVPAMVNRTLDQLYVMGAPAGPTVFQLVAVLMQYNELVEDIVLWISKNPSQAEARMSETISNLSGHLEAIGRNLDAAIREITPLHDEATA